MAVINTGLVHRTRFTTRDNARRAISCCIEGFYKRCRRHSALGCGSPAAFETIHATLMPAEAYAA